jgi:hypothetical protein
MRWTPLLLAPVLLATQAAAQGGPPLLTDDPGTPGAGRFEVNLATTFEKVGGSRVLEAPLLDLNYGLGESMQLKYEVPWVFLDDSATGESNGLGNSMLGFKWRFLDARGSSPAVSVYPQLHFENPGSSSSERGLADEGSSLLLPIEVAWELGEDVGMCLEIGRELEDHGSDGWMGGIAFGRGLSERADLLAEIHAEAAPSLGDSEGILNVGSRLRFGRGCSLLASAGTGVWSSGEERTDWRAYLGIQYLF